MFSSQILHAQKLQGNDGRSTFMNNLWLFLHIGMKNDISRKLIKQFLVNRNNDSEFKPVVANPNDNYLTNMIKYLNNDTAGKSIQTLNGI